MIYEMDKRIPAFTKVNRTRCFLHILNLVAKSLLKHFELPEKKVEDLTDEEKEVFGDIVELSEGIEAEEEETRNALEADVEGDELEDEDIEEWLDEVELTPEEEMELKAKVVPITRVLVKVSNLRHTIFLLLISSIL